jgi:hypothetical protein
MWSAHLHLFGVAWVMPRRVSELLGIDGQPLGVALMEDGSTVFDVVSTAGVECT